MKIKLIELYHLKGGLKSTFPSDTLWGNICWAMRYLYDEQTLLDFLNSYQSPQPQLIISSTFPFYKDNNTTKYFFPRPILPSKSYALVHQSTAQKSFEEKLNEITQRKKQKKIQFLERNFWEKILMGEADDENLPSENIPQWLVHSVTRNQINRIQGGTIEIEGTGQLFVEDEYFILSPSNDSNEFVGLFFLAQDYTDGKLEAILRLLSHIGIGGNRSIGKGNFEFSIHDIEIPEPQNPNAMLNLSLYYPKPDELAFYQQHPDRFFYQLETRSGFFGELKNGQYQKNPIMYFKEGSLFPFMESTVYGLNKRIYSKRENVKNDFDVFQYGIALMVKMLI